MTFSNFVKYFDTGIRSKNLLKNIFIFFWILSIVFFIILWLLHCYSLIAFPMVTEYRDLAQVQLANLLFNGSNPYSIGVDPPFSISMVF